MNTIRDEWTIIAACSIMAAVLVYLASCTAYAADAELRYQNSATVPLTALRITQDALPPTVVPVQCPALGTCKATVQLAHGAHATSIEAQAAGTGWSAPSNVVAYRAVDPVLCFADPVCRNDLDADGRVAGTDFTRFVATFGKQWP